MIIWIRSQLQIQNLQAELQCCWRIAIVQVKVLRIKRVPYQGLQLRVWPQRDLNDDLPSCFVTGSSMIFPGDFEWLVPGE